MRYIYQTNRDTVYTYPIPTSNYVHDTYSYHDPSSYKAILTISSSFIQLKELCITHINVIEHSNEQFPARRTFLSRKFHAYLIAGSLAELCYIGPKRDKAAMKATTQNLIQSSIIPLSRHYRSDQMYNLKILQGRFATDTFFSDIKSLHANTCCLVYLHEIGFAAFYPNLNVKGFSLGET